MMKSGEINFNQDCHEYGSVVEQNFVRFTVKQDSHSIWVYNQRWSAIVE